MLWTSCGLIVDFLPYYIKTKKETKKNSLKGSLKKRPSCSVNARVVFQTMLETSGNFQHSWQKFPA